MQNTNYKKNIALFFIVFLSTMHLPFSFGKSVLFHHHPVEASENSNITSDVTEVSRLYNQINLADAGLSLKAFAFAMTGFEKLKEAGKITNEHIISIVDFTRSSAKKRLFVIDLEAHQVLFNTYVAHGQNSGKEFATQFSNKPQSFQSSLGFYETAGTYQGKNGYSLQLIGLDRGWNDRADDRAIVMHGAPYVNEQLIRSQGYIGRSWGCPAVPANLCKPIIDKIKNGSCLFIFAENNSYLKKSAYLNQS